jgi:ATP-dependent Lon protease
MRTGLGSSRSVKESIDTAFNYFKANKKNISGSISIQSKDFLMHVQDVQGIGMTDSLSLAAFIGGTINKLDSLANTLQVCFDAGAKKILLPMSSATDIGTVPPEIFSKFQISFYQSPEEAVFKALGVE